MCFLLQKHGIYFDVSRWDDNGIKFMFLCYHRFPQFSPVDYYNHRFDELLNSSLFVSMHYSVCVHIPAWFLLWLDTHTRLMLLHDSRNDDGIKSFFQEVHELYIKVSYYLQSPHVKFCLCFHNMFLKYGRHVLYGFSHIVYHDFISCSLRMVWNE